MCNGVDWLEMWVCYEKKLPGTASYAFVSKLFIPVYISFVNNFNINIYNKWTLLHHFMNEVWILFRYYPNQWVFSKISKCRSMYVKVLYHVSVLLQSLSSNSCDIDTIMLPCLKRLIRLSSKAGKKLQQNHTNPEIVAFVYCIWTLDRHYYIHKISPNARFTFVLSINVFVFIVVRMLCMDIDFTFT